MYKDRIYSIFHKSIEAKMEAGDMLIDGIVAASELIVNSLLKEGKILTCGNATSAAMMQILTHNLIHRFERERPSLPSINLGNTIPNVTAITNELSISDIFAREIRAFAQSHDVVILASSSGNPSNLIQAIQSAHEKGISVIALTGRNGGNVASLLTDNDIEIRVPSSSRTRIHEVHLLIIFCLCDLIDEQLFGSQEI